jgi:hypothetical protein
LEDLTPFLAPLHRAFVHCQRRVALPLTGSGCIEGVTAMKKATFALLAVMALAIGVTALGSVGAQAKYTYLHQASDGNDTNGAQ